MYNDLSTLEKLIELKKDILDFDETILSRRVEQFTDDISLVASNPLYSLQTVRKLYDFTKGNDAIIFVAGHGSYGIGLDVILRYKELIGKNNLKFYPVRFSRSEYKGYLDRVPCLTELEIDYLKEYVKEKKIIVFDENSNTGTSVNTIANFISKCLGNKVKIIYNVNTSVAGDWSELFGKLQEENKLKY